MKVTAIRPRIVSFHQNKTGQAASVSQIRVPVRLADAPCDARRIRLTPRELEVLSLLCEGLPNKLISRRLNISAGTVKVHVGRILAELCVASRVQAVVAAQRLGLLSSLAAIARDPSYNGAPQHPQAARSHESGALPLS